MKNATKSLFAALTLTLLSTSALAAHPYECGVVQGVAAGADALTGFDGPNRPNLNSEAMVALYELNRSKSLRLQQSLGAIASRLQPGWIPQTLLDVRYMLQAQDGGGTGDQYYWRRRIQDQQNAFTNAAYRLNQLTQSACN